MSIRKLQNLEAYVKEYLTHNVYKKDYRALRRIRDRINKAIDKTCCRGDETPVLNITGPSGLIATGANPYLVHITSSVSDVNDSDVQNISLYIDDEFIETQDGNNFEYSTYKSAVLPAVESVYYTVAVLKSGLTLVSPIMQFTLTETAPKWSLLVGNHIARTGQTRHIVDRVSDVDLDTLSVTFINLPSFCTANLIPVLTGVPGQSVVIVDITVSPTVSNVGTFSFTMRATDGVLTTDKAISLQVNNNSHLTIMFPVNHQLNVPHTTPSFTDLDFYTLDSAADVIQAETVPTPNLIPFALSGNAGLNTLSTTGTISSSDVGKKQVIVAQFRNVTTGTGSRYEDSLYYILTIT